MNQITSELIRTALACIPPALPRDEWASVAMAIKSEFPDETGFELFDTWSQGDADGYRSKDARDTWKNVKPEGGVKIGTLLYMAKERGFTFPKPDPTRPAPAAPTAAQIAEQDRQRAERRQKDRARIQAAATDVAELAGKLWAEAAESGTNLYLTRKGVQAYGVRFDVYGRLLVPVRDGVGKLWNVQIIAPEKPADGTSDKRFLKGGRKSGLWHLLGDLTGADAVLLAEGYATAASLHEATDRPVACAFDAGNLVHVARALREAHPGLLIVLCGDDDRATAERTGGANPGREKAQAAARAVGGLAVFPDPLPEGGSDFNDLHQATGIDAVRAVVARAIDAWRARQAPKAAQAVAADVQAPNDPFIVTDDGVFYQGRDQDGNATKELWLCGRLEVPALTSDTSGQNWGFLLAFSDPNGHSREWAMPARMLASDGGEYRAALLGMGLSITTSPKGRNRLTEYLQTRHPKLRVTCTERIGWHRTTSGGAAYVLPGETIGGDRERIVHQTEAPTERTFSTRGDVAAWRDRLGALCIGNSRLVFTVACAFAGPLMRPGGVDSGGFHLRGASSSGKTTALRVAASVNGARDYMQRWRTTDNALELIAAQHCDALLILDELGQVDSRTVGECAYMLANETGKGRASRGAALRERPTWRLLFLSAGEMSLSDHMAEAMKRTRVGQEVRMVDLAADAGASMGVFEDLHDREGAAALASELNRAADAVYGAPGHAWLEWLAPRYREIAGRLHERTEALQRAWVRAGSSGQVERVATRFALVAVAGELATEAGLTGWPAGESERAGRRCFESWLEQRGGTGDAEVRNMLRQVCNFFELNAEGRFTWWHRAADDHNAKTLNRAGFRRLLTPDGEPIKRDSQHAVEFGDRMPPDLGESSSSEYFVLPEVFRTEVCKGFDHRAVCRMLVERGALKTDPGHYTEQQRLPGIGPTRCYHVTPKILDVIE